MAKAIRTGVAKLVVELRLKEDGAAVNISSATVKEIVFKKPSGAEVRKAAAFTTDGTDGKLKYVVVSKNEIDEVGDWRLEAYVEMPSFEGPSHEVTLRVK